MGWDASWDRLLSWLAVHQISPTMCSVTHMEYKLIMLIITSTKNDATKPNMMMKKDRCKKRKYKDKCASVARYKFEPIAVTENKNTKPTNVTSYKFVMFASYKFEIIAVAGTTNTKHTSVTSSEFVINTSMTSSKFITFAMNKYKNTIIMW